jgi:hypothetical protein
MTVSTAQRIVGRYIDGTLDVAAVRMLLGAIRAASGDPAAPLAVAALHILSDPSPESQRRERLAALMNQQPRD